MRPSTKVLALALLVTSMSLLVTLPSASAFYVGDGTVLKNGNMTLTLHTGGSNPVNITFNHTTGAPILWGITLDLEATTGRSDWMLTEASPSRFIFTGNPTGTGTLTVSGFQCPCQASGILGTDAATYDTSPFGPISIVPGQQTISVATGALANTVPQYQANPYETSTSGGAAPSGGGSGGGGGVAPPLSLNMPPAGPSAPSGHAQAASATHSGMWPVIAIAAVLVAFATLNIKPHKLKRRGGRKR